MSIFTGSAPVGASTLRAAKTFCALSGWRLSNLALQKLVYLAHMMLLGSQNFRLVSGMFEAWELGPVEPHLYRKVRAYGDGPIADIFAESIYPKNSSEYRAIAEVYRQLGNARPGRLVEITHEPGYAWARCYVPNARGIVIPDEEIASEFRRRKAKSDAKRRARSGTS